VKVIDPVTNEVLKGEATGELLVSGPGVFKGYFEDQKNTSETLKDGWLHTGDLVHRDKDGYFRIVDRIKDIFITGGESVAPAEIEKVLFGHPAVQDCAVVGVPDDRWGEVPIGFVVRRGGVPTDEQDILDYLTNNLAKFKIPKQIKFITKIPRSSSEKVRRRMLASDWQKAEGVLK
jgi:fatty-acyl-CoA synthase